MNHTKSIGKALAFGLLFGCTAPMEAQYLERIYDYIENLEVFEENQEEGHAYYVTDDHLSLNGQWRFFFAN